MMTLTSQEVIEIDEIISRLSGTQAASANTGATVPVPVSADNNASGSCDENQEASSSSGCDSESESADSNPPQARPPKPRYKTICMSASVIKKEFRSSLENQVSNSSKLHLWGTHLFRLYILHLQSLGEWNFITAILDPACLPYVIEDILICISLTPKGKTVISHMIKIL